MRKKEREGHQARKGTNKKEEKKEKMRVQEFPSNCEK